MTATAAPADSSRKRLADFAPGGLWVVLWTLLVVDVQPWSSRPSAPQGSTDASNSLLKGALLGGVFLLALVSTKPGFRTRVSGTTFMYLGYVLFATATGFLLAEPMTPLLRLVRLATGLLLMMVIWRPLLSVPERLVKAHLYAHVFLAGLIAVGVLVSPSQAWRQISSLGAGYRLQGVILPMLPPRVGEVGALVCGLALIAVLNRRMKPIPGTMLVFGGLTLIALSKTRTAAAALGIGLVLALFLTRKTWLGRFATVLAPFGVVGVFLVVPVLHSWLLRGQGTKQLESLSGRTLAWSYIIEEKVAPQTALIGHGLGNKRVLLRRGEGDIDVQPIDNSWLGLYWETGLLGVALIAIAFILAWVAVVRAPTPYIRASTAMLMGYLTLASINESGLSDLSSMTVHLLAAAAVADADRWRSKSAGRAESASRTGHPDRSLRLAIARASDPGPASRTGAPPDSPGRTSSS
ncbi:hypothetical protein OG394_11700 [Kribbella sp. NBC_01245]|uniref:O-antigen ligase family protein n=1 Tax=Kribbella sp. NBC_01245 TaxID=2903578 RepID=UPI002E281411|nr:O-antigen ligase family protein [Kribbella sp. NBC_01245]